MPRRGGVRDTSTVTVLACELSEITDEHSAPIAQQLADGLILVIATRRQAADGTPLWLRVWRPGRWIYLAAFAARSAEEATAYARSGPAEMAKRAPDRWSLAALQGAAQTAIERFYYFERSKRVSSPPPARMAPERTPPPPAPDARAHEAPGNGDAVRRAAIARYDLAEVAPPPVAAARLAECLFVLALLRNNPRETLDVIAPIREHTLWLTPLADADDALVAELWQRGWLRIDASSPIDAFDWDGLVPTAHYLNSVVWRLVLPADAPTPQRLMAAIEQRVAQRPWVEQWYVELPLLWAWLAQMECVAYLELALADHALPFHAGEKTHHTIAKLLEHFTIGQIHNLIWRAARDAGARIRREPIAPQHAANTAVGALERMGDRALTEEWTVKSYRRDRRLEESTLSHIVFRLILGMDDPFAVRPDWKAFRETPVS